MTKKILAIFFGAIFGATLQICKCDIHTDNILANLDAITNVAAIENLSIFSASATLAFAILSYIGI